MSAACEKITISNLKFPELMSPSATFKAPAVNSPVLAKAPLTHSVFSDGDFICTARCEADHAEISRITDRPGAWVEGMMLRREGHVDDSHMVTQGLHNLVEQKKSYRVSASLGLLATRDDDRAIDLEQSLIDGAHDCPPAHTSLFADWDEQIFCKGGAENALGDNGLLTLPSRQSQVEIPIIDADRDALLYYGATLLGDGDVVRFPNDQYAIWNVGIGRNYVDDYLMTDIGKGCYLEYHNDRPHWHQPLSSDCGGFYVLARRVGNSASGGQHFHVTGFRIPRGKAVYTGLGAIHADSALVGERWLMGYDEAEDFSTVLMRNREQAMVKFVPAEMEVSPQPEILPGFATTFKLPSAEQAVVTM